ncbi:hypothetical protein SKAU_G00145690 [Synaphobranchus kaupii]|uniref:Uncharacterized protein n=1 Tax=Synaphobranchus kaupii TaxID=118154 RepID=A0A9Q1FU72_SYNKA|nr:hypothetical protein SKAU_G00145690 [Synaphobranchus kaupii]
MVDEKIHWGGTQGSQPIHSHIANFQFEGNEDPVSHVLPSSRSLKCVGERVPRVTRPVDFGEVKRIGRHDIHAPGRPCNDGARLEHRRASGPRLDDSPRRLFGSRGRSLTSRPRG